MKIEQNKVTNIRLTDIDGLEPITVFLEDFKLGSGKITIECAGQSWSSFWPSMGCSIAEFVVDCDDDYLIENLSGIESELIIEGRELQEYCKTRIIKLRKKEQINSDEARELFQMAKKTTHHMDNIQLIERVYGMSWYIDLPTVPNPEYQRLSRIIKAVQEGLREVNQAEAA